MDDIQPKRRAVAFSTGLSALVNSGMTATVFPNPAFGSSKLTYTLTTGARVQIAVTDLTGQLVRPLAAEWRPAGSYTEDLGVGQMSAGLYFVELIAGEEKKVFELVVR